MITKERREIGWTEESLLKELEKGIVDMEHGHIVPHDDAMQVIRERISKYDI